ncbi:hypothetical protein [Pseudothermotoga thermarum]|nr:hypothetical protein [Pseudothermotoga thermarum]
MAKVLLAIIGTGLLYLVERNLFNTLLFFVILTLSSVYFVVFSKNRKIDTLHTLTIILTFAAAVLPKLKGAGSYSVAPFYLAVLTLVPYDLTYYKKIWYIFWFSFWLLVSYGLYRITWFKLGRYSILVFLVIAPIALRDLFERRKGCGRKVCPISDERTLDDESKS